MKYIDAHSHVIWGVDDGASIKEETINMLQAAAKDNIAKIICTPHIIPGIKPFQNELFEKHLTEAKEYIKNNNLDLMLYVGSEVFYTDSTARYIREGRLYGLAGTNRIMIEFDPDESKERICSGLQKIASTGYIPVLAHAERYKNIRNMSLIKEIKANYDTLIQINARSLIRKLPLLKRKYLDSLFREGMVDYVATDTHSLPGRETCMTEGMNKIIEKYGENTYNNILKATKALIEKE